ncbi:MAG: cation:proton antiporter [Actinomycetota bacterium]|nr:cation:proton antiporter [Actinomycetota bacterium]
MAAEAGSPEAALLFLELGALVVGLALLARLASRIGFSPIPLYLLAGLAFGRGGLLPLGLSEEFVAVGAEIGVVLLLFMLGLEYSGEELGAGLRRGVPAGAVDLGLNFTPGFLAGLALGWEPVAALLLGGVTYISSSGVIAKVLADLDRLGNRETPTVLSLLVIEDLAMAVYLPLVAVLLVGGGVVAGALSLAVAVGTVAVVLLLAVRFGEPVSRVVHSHSDEVLLLTVFGTVLLVAGVAQRLQVSSAVGSFLVGIALSGEVAERARVLLGPLRDLFAAVFFIFFSLQIDPAGVPAVAAVAIALSVVTAGTKMATGWWAARRAGVRTRGRWRAGATLTARGEFSIVIAGLGVAAGVEPGLGALAAAYVLIMAVLGPVVTRFVDPLVAAVLEKSAKRASRRSPDVTRVDASEGG